MAAKKATAKAKELKKQFLNQLLQLVTSGFGLVAALAWNSLITEGVKNYIQPLIGGSSGLISLAIYALLVTILAVLVTYSLTRIVKQQ